MAEQVTSYSQRDSRWSMDRLGNTQHTLGLSGCLVSSVASILTDFGVVHTPATLNSWLRDHNGYVGDGNFIFRSVNPLGVEMADFISSLATPAPVKYIADALATGAGVVIMVDFKPAGAVQQHWVRLLSLSGRLSGDIMDPWQMPGGERTDLARYMSPGWNHARGIFATCIYRKSAAKNAAQGD